MTPELFRGARELLNWTEAELAHRAGLQLSTVRYAESMDPRPRRRTLATLRRALETAGVDFIAGADDDLQVSSQSSNPQHPRTGLRLKKAHLSS